MNTLHTPFNIFDRNAIRAHQAATWRRTDVPVEVLIDTPEGIKRLEYADLAAAQKDYPHLTLGAGMRGQWNNPDGTVRCEYVLRFEEYK